MKSSTKIQTNKKGGKRIRAARLLTDRNVFYDINSAIDLLKNLPQKVNFDETLELALKLGVDPKHSDQMVRGIVQMPNGTGKSVKIAVLVKPEKIDEAKKAGADIVGSDNLIEDIKNNNIDFDILITTLDMMPSIASISKILGPKGLMPNPRSNTIVKDIESIEKRVADAKAGQVEFRTDKNGIIHAGFGKSSFDNQKLKENLITLIDAISKLKPNNAKGTYLKQMSICSTMGPSVKIDLSSIQQ